jgi:hypothetical protein
MKPSVDRSVTDPQTGLVAPEWVQPSSSAPSTPHYFITPVRPPLPGSEPFVRGMRDVGGRLREANVAAIYLVHGTFVGNDPWGTHAGLNDLAPRYAAWWRRTTKRLIDRMMNDTANYTLDYAQLLERSLTAGGELAIPVRRFIWSGENNHIGRAAAAVALVDELAARNFAPGQRVLLWCHSHGGNVLALFSHLLAADKQVRGRFFEATQVYYGKSGRPDSVNATWRRVRELLDRPRDDDRVPAFLRHRGPGNDGQANTAGTALDVATLGTPIRYRWHLSGVDRLLHFVNHHPVRGHANHQSALPRHIGDVLFGTGGDYVQHMGIEGTNFPPLPWCWKTWLADIRLARLISPELKWYRLPHRVRAGLRVPSAGTTLLVDYGRERSRWIRHMAGHSIYTRTHWMLFHAEQVACRLYDAPQDELSPRNGS